MKYIYLIIKGLFANKSKIIILIAQIFLFCLVANLLICKFTYLDNVRSSIYSSKLSNAILFQPSNRFTFTLLGINQKSNLSQAEIDTNKRATFAQLSQKIATYTDIKVIGGIKDGMGDFKSNKENINVLIQAYDKVLLDKLKLPLQKGKLSDLIVKDDDKIPIVISYVMGKTYKIGSTFELNIYKDDKPFKTVTVVVKGILKQRYFSYAFPTGASDASGKLLTNLVSLKISSNNDFYIVMPSFDSSDITSSAFIDQAGMVCFTDKASDISKNLASWNARAKSEGLGFFVPFSDMNNRDWFQMISLNRQYISIGILIFIISLIGIGGYNFIRLLISKREFAILFISGMYWSNLICSEIIRNLIIVIIPSTLSLLVVNFIAAQPIGQSSMLFDIYNYLFTLASILFFVIVATLTIHFMLKDRSIIKLMRKDEQ